MVARRFRSGEACRAESGEHAIADLRLADLISALSQVTDLGMGQPPEEAIRSCLLATALARRMDLRERDVVGDIYFTTLLQHIGCTAYAYETAALFGGDDVARGDRDDVLASHLAGPGSPGAHHSSRDACVRELRLQIRPREAGQPEDTDADHARRR